MKRYVVYLLFLMSVLGWSCERLIDLKPLDQISVDDYWKTPADLQNYVKQFYQNFSPQTQMVAELAVNSDDMVHGSPSAILNGQRTARTGSWQGEWAAIRHINIFFDNYEKCEAEFSEIRHTVGEAHFFRAWYYFGLLKEYGDIPWYTSEIGLDDDQALMRPRDPRTQVADNILAELDKAIEFLDTRRSVGNTRISKEAALALKTRVALFEGSWQKYHANTPFGTAGADPQRYFQACVSAAEELMGGNYTRGIYTTGNPDDDYYRLFGLDNMNDVDEVLLYRAFNRNEGAGNAVQGYITYDMNQKGITWDLVSSYLGRDGKPYDYLEVGQIEKGNDFLLTIAAECDRRLKSTIWIPGDLMAAELEKYFDRPTIDAGALQLNPTGFSVKKTANPYSPAAGRPWSVQAETGFIILRYAEVLLNYAEAYYELNQEVAYEALNRLRERAGMPAFEVHSQQLNESPANYGYEIPDALYEIRRERRVEMALEGYRDEDYRRWAAHALFRGQRPKGYPVSREEFPAYSRPVDSNGLIDYYADELPEGYQFQPGRDYLSSIPLDELTLNPNLVPNPGW
ncbi:RagB/SusD family nutrient uptake outer membrane protein [Parapedobacter indicus]|uniref:Starch-binding associating with outer membrane n=1 Tax=Parapedobacter indicus TaxID=1477437 RepID=A0A1I3TFD9_9SPHI|nr:RagB/SusD family nutrient uptake outer membrane protein [Parapedobacter indicus]PPK99523.1 putative outer membrane starch-binding protein [Parapedobacter indicus]SFJ69193.1 Starch-binding associating with outer membrane [Parapedobacter indicus]